METTFKVQEKKITAYVEFYNQENILQKNEDEIKTSNNPTEFFTSKAAPGKRKGKWPWGKPDTQEGIKTDERVEWILTAAISWILWKWQVVLTS